MCWIYWCGNGESLYIAVDVFTQIYYGHWLCTDFVHTYNNTKYSMKILPGQYVVNFTCSSWHKFYLHISCVNNYPYSGYGVVFTALAKLPNISVIQRYLCYAKFLSSEIYSLYRIVCTCLYNYFNIIRNLVYTCILLQHH